MAPRLFSSSKSIPTIRTACCLVLRPESGAHLLVAHDPEREMVRRERLDGTASRGHFVGQLPLDPREMVELGGPPSIETFRSDSVPRRCVLMRSWKPSMTACTTMFAVTPTMMKKSETIATLRETMYRRAESEDVHGGDMITPASPTGYAATVGGREPDQRARGRPEQRNLERGSPVGVREDVEVSPDVLEARRHAPDCGGLREIAAASSRRAREARSRDPATR